MFDANEYFDSSKLDQITRATDKAAAVEAQVKEGALRDNGNGTYTVLTGWDSGETIRLSRKGQ